MTLQYNFSSTFYLNLYYPGILSKLILFNYSYMEHIYIKKIYIKASYNFEFFLVKDKNKTL